MVFYIYKMKDVNYIGSTDNIKRRTRKHKYICRNQNNKNYNLLIYQYIREKQKDIELEILGVYKKKCSKRIKLLVEQFYINKYNSVNNGLNTINAFGFDKKKYYQINKEKIKEYDKKKYENNKETIIEMKKEYYQSNKKTINQKSKKYYEDNKEKLKQKINCPICNSLTTKRNLRRHQKSKKCLKVKNSNISQNEIDFKYNQNAYNEEGEFLEWF